MSALPPYSFSESASQTTKVVKPSTEVTLPSTVQDDGIPIVIADSDSTPPPSAATTVPTDNKSSSGPMTSVESVEVLTRTESHSQVSKSRSKSKSKTNTTQQQQEPMVSSTLASPSAATSAHASMLSSAAASSSSSSLTESQVTSSSVVPSTYKEYRTRWLVLAIYCLGTLTNAIQWISFASIQSAAASLYGVNSAAINSLSVIFMALYLPGSIFAFYVMEKYSLRLPILFAATMQFVGGWIRYISTDGWDDMNGQARAHGFVALVIGQTLSGFVQPIFVNSPARIASEWFSIKNRDVATTIASMANPIGIALGQLLPVLVNVDTVTGIGMAQMLLVEAILASVVAILTYFFFYDRPPSPPSHSMAMKYQNKVNHPFKEQMLAIYKETKGLLSNYNFVVLLIGFSIGLGLFNAISTLISQLIEPTGYTSNDGSTFGALIIGCGLLGAAIFGPIMDYTHRYNLLLHIGSGCCCASLLLLILVLRPDSFGEIALAFGLTGFFILPLLPISFECAVECTYPVNEDVANGLMMTGGNLLGIIHIYSLAALINVDALCCTVITPAAIFIFVFMLGCLLTLVFLYNGPTRRLHAEGAHARQDESASLPSPRMTGSDGDVAISAEDAKRKISPSATIQQVDSSPLLNGDDNRPIHSGSQPDVVIVHN